MNGRYQMLEGAPYARYALPLDYLPSRDLNPRWGYGRPPMTALARWMEAEGTQYRALLAQMRRYMPEFRRIPRNFSHEALPEPAWLGTAINPLDTAALYTLIRENQPRRYFEIGSGISTCFARRAVSDGRLDTHILSIDPEPRAEIDAICDTVIRQGLEQVDLSIFGQLEAGDILFLDGSHRCFMNSDVTVFFIEVLPRLAPGVLVHIHDIFLPSDYPELFKTWYWSEQYLLATYILAAPDRVRPVFPAFYVTSSDWFLGVRGDPLVDFGEEHPDAWRWGGSFWFTPVRS